MGSSVSRVPEEIGGEGGTSVEGHICRRRSQKKGHSLPALFTFPSPSRDALDKYLHEIIQEGLWLTGNEGDWVETSTRNGMKCEFLKIAGTQIDAVRHTADFDAEAEYLFDLYNRLNYTDVIDAYTFLVDMTEEIDLTGMKAADFLSWAHVVWTVDRLMLPLRSIRDFVTLDAVSKRDLVLVSKSVVHPRQPVTSSPGWGSLLGGDEHSPTYRVPLMYALKITAKAEGGCTVAQVQWSDVGGVVPPPLMAQTVVKFGFDNMERFAKLVANAKERKLPLGRGTEGFLADPMLPSWRQSANEMVPNIE